MDLIAADLTVTSERLGVVAFSRPFIDAPLTVLTAVSSVWRRIWKYLPRRRTLEIECITEGGRRGRGRQISCMR